jgi:uncharacterized protein
MLRLLSLPLLSVLIHGFLALRLLPSLPAMEAWPLGTLLFISMVLVPQALGGRRGSRTELRRKLTATGMLAMGWMSSLFVLTVIKDLVLLIVSLGSTLSLWHDLPAVLAPWPSRTAFFVSVLLTVWGAWQARRTPSIAEVDIPIPGLPPALNGFTIVQLSDIHVGPTIRALDVQAMVERANALAPDAIVITGDLVDGAVADLAPHTAPLSGLSAPAGCYMVTGNHEYYSGAEEWITEFRRLGLTVLMNEHAVIDRHGSRLVLAGVPDYTAHHFVPSHRSDPAAALKDVPEDAAVRILLAHQPRTAPLAAKAGFDIQLSGHTHGGQFWPWKYFVPMQQPLVEGLHKLEGMWVYVSRGTGYWGPPKRVAAPSEITCIRLIPAA